MFCTTLYSQSRDYMNEMEQNDLRIRQKPNTEGFLSDYLHSVNRFFSNFSTKPHILYEGAIFLRKFNIKN